MTENESILLETEETISSVTEATPELAEAAPETAEAAPETAETAPEPAEAAPEPAETAPETAEAAPEPAETAPEPAEASPEKGKKRKSSGFSTGLVIYTWVLLALVGAALGYFYLYLGAYEHSRVKRCEESYLEAVHQQPPEAAALALADLDPAIRSPEENLLWTKALFSDCELLRQASQSTETTKVYSVKASDGQIIGSVTFAVTSRGDYKLPVWEKVDERYDFHSYYRMTELVVPPDYSVTLGGKLLGPEAVVERDIPFAALEECYLHYDNLPRLIRYSGGPFLEMPELTILDPDGVRHSPEELTEELFLDNCRGEARERVEDFIPGFVTLYGYYSADVNGSAMAYYGRVRRLTVPDSQLWDRINHAVGSFGWSNTKALQFEDIQIRLVTDLGENRYLALVSYDTLITGLHGAVPSHDDVQIILVDLDGTLLADALYYV